MKRPLLLILAISRLSLELVQPQPPAWRRFLHFLHLAVIALVILLPIAGRAQILPACLNADGTPPTPPAGQEYAISVNGNNDPASLAPMEHNICYTEAIGCNSLKLRNVDEAISNSHCAHSTYPVPAYGAPVIFGSNADCQNQQYDYFIGDPNAWFTSWKAAIVVINDDPGLCARNGWNNFPAYHDWFSYAYYDNSPYPRPF